MLIGSHIKYTICSPKALLRGLLLAGPSHCVAGVVRAESSAVADVRGGEGAGAVRASGLQVQAHRQADEQLTLSTARCHALDVDVLHGEDGENDNRHTSHRG